VELPVRINMGMEPTDTAVYDALGGLPKLQLLGMVKS
jgi:hypothetical protein